ncbi:MAG TPA: hypothetical protein VHD63_19390 [Ktedonobacteraceae bacterium]|nr:hypothetical protein [Ktedonobacteraceae bacterium]
MDDGLNHRDHFPAREERAGSPTSASSAQGGPLCAENEGATMQDAALP